MKPEDAMQWRHARSEVGLAEALQASMTLGVRGGTRAQWLAEALELTWSEGATAVGPPLSAPSGSHPAASTAGSASSPAAAPAREVKRLKILEPVSQEPIVFEQYFAEYAEKIREAEEIAPATLKAAQARPSYRPLFLERWFQGIFTATLSTQMASREIDFRKLERNVAHGETLAELPFKLRASLVKGVHVLLDHSETMQPFWRDETELIARLRRLLGEALVQHAWFEMDPQRAAAKRLRWRGTVPRKFHQETPVLLVTDFGVGLDAAAARFMDWESWLPIFHLAESSRSRVTALLPSAPALWPAGLNRFVAGALLWDRETSPHAAARSCRR